MIKQIAAVAGLIVALTSICACHKASSTHQPPTTLPPGPGHHHGQENGRPFEITIYTDLASGMCFADFPAATLWNGKMQTATWFSDDSDYRVDFNGTNGNPFSGSNPFVLPAGSSVSSNALKREASGNYEYTLEDKGGKSCNTVADPVIYVKP